MKTIAKIGIAITAVSLLASCEFFSPKGKTPDTIEASSATTIDGINVDTMTSTTAPVTTITGTAE